MYCMSSFKAFAHPVPGILEKIVQLPVKCLRRVFHCFNFSFVEDFEVSFFVFKSFGKFGAGLMAAHNDHNL